MKREKSATVALNTLPGFRAVLFHRALARFGTPSGVVAAGEKALLSVSGIGPASARAVGNLDVSEAWEKEAGEAKKRGVTLVTIFDDSYPAGLRTIHDPPPVLYVRGTLLPADERALAIVGSRQATVYGKTVSYRLARDLAAEGVTVVSGMARGIDSAAHRGALEGGGRTIAVLGSGLDRVYPPENRRLAEEISGGGALVTEFSFGSAPEKWRFPMRNRTVSGLSLGVAVVEAAERSGALITADCALDEGREVFAVPGSITSPKSAGPHKLLREGACLVAGVGDIFDELPRLRGGVKKEHAAPSMPRLSEEQKRVLSYVGREPLHQDEVIRKAAAPSSRTLSILTALEIKGLVRRHGGGLYVRP